MCAHSRKLSSLSISQTKQLQTNKQKYWQENVKRLANYFKKKSKHVPFYTKHYICFKMQSREIALSSVIKFKLAHFEINLNASY